MSYVQLITPIKERFIKLPHSPAAFFHLELKMMEQMDEESRWLQGSGPSPEPVPNHAAALSPQKLLLVPPPPSSPADLLIAGLSRVSCICPPVSAGMRCPSRSDVVTSRPPSWCSAAHLSRPPRAASTLWIKALKDGRRSRLLLQHSSMMA